MKWEQAARLVIPAAQALSFAHQHGIIHGHVRPSSIVIREDGTPVLFDFGVELLIAQEVFAATNVNWIGSDVSSYAAPEQILGKKFDHRSDIYSFGMLLYELVTGQRAFQGETALDEILHQLEGKPEDVRNKTREVPKIGREILEKALAPDPEKAFPGNAAPDKLAGQDCPSPTNSQENDLESKLDSTQTAFNAYDCRLAAFLYHLFKLE